MPGSCVPILLSLPALLLLGRSDASSPPEWFGVGITLERAFCAFPVSISFSPPASPPSWFNSLCALASSPLRTTSDCWSLEEGGPHQRKGGWRGGGGKVCKEQAKGSKLGRWLHPCSSHPSPPPHLMMCTHLLILPLFLGLAHGLSWENLTRSSINHHH